MGFEPGCIAAHDDLVVIGNKTGKDCFIYTKTGGGLTPVEPKKLGIDDPIFAVTFRYDFEK